MTWILGCFERLAGFETQTGAHVMRHENSVFHTLLKQVPWQKLVQIVEKFGADASVRRVDTKRHLIALLYGQLSGATSLREIVAGTESHAARLCHVGAAPVKRSTVS